MEREETKDRVTWSGNPTKRMRDICWFFSFLVFFLPFFYFCSFFFCRASPGARRTPGLSTHCWSRLRRWPPLQWACVGGGAMGGASFCGASPVFILLVRIQQSEAGAGGQPQNTRNWGTISSMTLKGRGSDEKRGSQRWEPASQ